MSIETELDELSPSPRYEGTKKLQHRCNACAPPDRGCTSARHRETMFGSTRHIYMDAAVCCECVEEQGVTSRRSEVRHGTFREEELSCACLLWVACRFLGTSAHV